MLQVISQLLYAVAYTAGVLAQCHGTGAAVADHSRLEDVGEKVDERDHGPLGSDVLGDRRFIQSVLHRCDVTVLGQPGSDPGGRFVGRLGFYGQEHPVQFERSVVERESGDVSHEGAVGAFDLDPLSPDGFDVLGVGVYQLDRDTVGVEVRGEGAADRSRADYCVGAIRHGFLGGRCFRIRQWQPGTSAVGGSTPLPRSLRRRGAFPR